MTVSLAIDVEKLDALFEPHNRSDRPGLVVGVASRGVPVYRRGFGLAHAELPMTLTPTMRLRIGSTSKHFTCLAIMLLAEEGKLSTSDALRRHLPELEPWAEHVSLAAAMSHTGGVRCSLDILTLFAKAMSRPLEHAEQFKILTKLRTANFESGADYLYSNGGYVLLTNIVARLSGVPFETFVQERILRPVGMHDTTLRPIDTDCLPNSATLHVPKKGGGYAKGVFGPEIGGEGSMVSTVDDMLLWLRHMSAPSVGSAQSWAEMRTPVDLPEGRTGYGYGLTTAPYRGLEVVKHSGSVVGGACQMLKVLDHELDIIIMTNLGGINPIALAESVVDACFDGLTPTEDFAPGKLPSGDFFSPASGRLVRIVDQEGLPALDYGHAQLPLKPAADGAFWFLTNEYGGSLLKAHGEGVDWIEFGVTHHLAPVVPPNALEAPQIAGRYASAELEVSATVAAGDQASIAFEGPYGRTDYGLEPRGRGLWALTSTDGFAGTLERDGADLLVSSARAKRLRFVPTTV